MPSAIQIHVGVVDVDVVGITAAETFGITAAADAPRLAK